MGLKHWSPAVCAAALTLLSICSPRLAWAEQAATPSTAQPPAAHSTRLILLGTGGGPIVRKLRAQPASLLVVDDVAYLIDAGADVVRQLTLAGFRPDQVRTIFITHHHLDHNGGLEPLLGFIWAYRNGKAATTPPVQIYGPPATNFLVRSSLDYFSVSERIFDTTGRMTPAKSMFESHDIDHDGVFYSDDKIRVSAVQNTHYHFNPGSAADRAGDKAYSYRFDTPNGSVVFTGDTGPSDAVTTLAEGADVLVSEVIDEEATQRYMQTTMQLPPKVAQAMVFHMLNEHLAPEEIGKMAAKARVGMVVLTHFSPGLDAETDTTGYTGGVTRYFSGPVIAGRDLFEYDLFKR